MLKPMDIFYYSISNYNEKMIKLMKIEKIWGELTFFFVSLLHLSQFFFFVYLFVIKNSFFFESFCYK